MSIADIFKRKSQKESSAKPQKETDTKLKPAKPKERIEEKVREVLKSPQITEKATEKAKLNQYTFKILPRANKMAIKKAIEDLYGVDVLDVKIIQTPKKARRLGKFLGWRRGYKKAMVKIKAGQKIEVLPR
jgi:large subunit ribosomal protein L23